MSMSDCIHCWDTPCTCGYDYLYHTPQRLAEIAKLFAELQAFQTAFPSAPRLTAGGWTSMNPSHEAREARWAAFNEWRKKAAL